MIQIVPVRATALEGVGDYARLLAERLLTDHALRTIFVAGTPLPPADQVDDSWETHTVRRRTARALYDILAMIEAIESDGDTPILLHLSGYGYHDSGAPLWLSTAMERWRRRNPETPLVTVFHELFATGRVWRKAFWYGPFQAWTARRIQAVSSAGIATTELYAAQLKRWRGRQDIEIAALPVFSTIGERDGATATARAPSMAIFARGDGIYRALPRIERIVAEHGVTEIVDIGSRAEPVPSRIGAATVRSLGRLPADQLSDALARVRFGLLDYDADRLAKSTIFAAYCAHGAIPICLSDAAGVQDGLRPGGNYLKSATHDKARSMTRQELESVQQGASDWYRPHSLAATAARLAAMLASPSALSGRG